MVNLPIDGILDLMKYGIVNSKSVAVIGIDKVTRVWPLKKVKRNWGQASDKIHHAISFEDPESQLWEFSANKMMWLEVADDNTEKGR